MLETIRKPMFVMSILTTILLTGCGKEDSSAKSDSENFDHADLVASKSYAQSYTYIFKLTEDIGDTPEQELKRMSEDIARRTINQNDLRNPNIAIYMFENDQVIPDVSGYFSDHFDLTDYMYEGDHGKWSYIYMHPLVGEPTWISCNGGESELCR